jgi:hypothetical protein
MKKVKKKVRLKIMNSKNKKKTILIFVVLLTFFVSISTMAILRSKINSSASLRTATWSVSLNQTGVNNNLTVTPDVQDATYTLNVVNNSEVDIIYTIVVSNIPSGVQVSLDNGTFQTPSSGTVTFTDAGTLLYSTQSHQHSHTLTFRAVTGTQQLLGSQVNINVLTRQTL